MIKLQPHIDVRSADLIEFGGVRGPFYVCNAGGWPERGHCFFYGDQKYQFFFYADFIRLGGTEYEIKIQAATRRRLAGPIARIDEADFEYIENNIRAALKQRNFLLLERPHRPGEAPHSVEFAWRAVP